MQMHSITTILVTIYLCESILFLKQPRIRTTITESVYFPQSTQRVGTVQTAFHNMELNGIVD